MSFSKGVMPGQDETGSGQRQLLCSPGREERLRRKAHPLLTPCGDSSIAKPIALFKTDLNLAPNKEPYLLLLVSPFLL
jgi:hypothetical protein